MENITLGQISGIFVFCITLVGALSTTASYLKKALNNAFKPLNEKLDNIEKSLGEKIDKVDKNSTMNYLVRCFNDIDRDIKLDSVSVKRLKEQYEHYIKDLNGNTYIHDEYERLKREGKL